MKNSPGAKDSRIEIAAELKSRMNCSQAVVMAYQEELPFDAQALMSLCAGFGSGMGTMDGTCGALVGAIMVAGLMTKGAGTIGMSRKILTRFRELSGSIVCRELKGIDSGMMLCPCVDCVRNAVMALEELRNAN